MSKLKILVIDDEPDFCFFLKENLELTGSYEVTTAVSGAEGLARAIRERPDLILLDLLLPRIDGARIYHELDNLPATRHIPTVILTAVDVSTAREHIPELPKEAFLTKPIQLVELKACIERILQKG